MLILLSDAASISSGTPDPPAACGGKQKECHEQKVQYPPFFLVTLFLGSVVKIPLI